MQFNWEKLKGAVEWIYHLVKPKTHNRIALVVVVAGVAVIASPFWEPYIRAILEHVFAIKIDPPTPPIFGIVLVFIGVIYHYGALKIEHETTKLSVANENSRKHQIVEHDKKIAAELRRILTEANKQRLEIGLLNEHAYWSGQEKALGVAVDYLDADETHFLDEKLRKLAKGFADAGADLIEFLGLKFFTYPREQREPPLRYAMQPSWNMDRDGNGSPEQIQKYDALTKELTEKVGRMSETYASLIRAFHEQLLN